MKKLFRTALVLLLLLSLAGCGRYVSLMPGTELPQAEAVGEDGEPLFEVRPLLTFLRLDGFAESYYTDTPAALSYRRVTAEGTAGCRSYVFDRAAIVSACDALRAMTVTAPAELPAAETADYTLTMADGTEHVFSFALPGDGRVLLRTTAGAYLVEGGEALFDLAFPAYSPDYDVFDLYFDSAVRSFADGFGTNTPVSVGYRMNSGASITTTDPAAVEGVFRALAEAEIIVVENQPDQNIDLNDTRDYFFTMENGDRYTFSFAQRCLAVTANASFGPVYYWITGTDALWGVEIASENSNGAFEGGTVAELRDDIRRAAQIAEGTYDADLEVLGVFVEYAIGEESGYIALDGDKADDFVRRVCAVQADGETEDDPSGDKVTVSVTLSDSSGPILYFTGDSIQQVVGINYRCDARDMSALREEILSLAADGTNTAEIEEGGTD